MYKEENNNREKQFQIERMTDVIYYYLRSAIRRNYWETLTKRNSI